MTSTTQLLLIDPQNDFCDLPKDWCPMEPITRRPLAPALPVAGAHADMLRLAGLIRQGASAISGITVTLDSHHRLDIAHPTFWRTAQGQAVAPFTAISAAQVRDGSFAPQDDSALARTLAYLDALESSGRYGLMVWPIHCEIGSWGHNVHASVKAAYNQWEEDYLKVVNTVSKGSNPWTEHYSALQAEVPDLDDPATQLNTALISALDQSDWLVIAGQASSHCVRASTEHLVAHLPSAHASKMILVSDCMSPVSGFEAQQEAFFVDMLQRGVQLQTSAQVLDTLLSTR